MCPAHAPEHEGSSSDVAPDGQVERDPLDGDTRLPDLFGEAWPAVLGFHDLLADQGVLRGLVGPRELSRLWERHLVNSAAVVPFLPESGQIVDVGSGAGLPGVVIAAMRPAVDVVLLEPMERRTDWLSEVVERLELSNVTVVRGRAEEQVGLLQADAVTARAVAALAKLYPWTMPLLRVGGELVALKGGRAADEVTAGADVLMRHGGGEVRIEAAPTLDGLEATTVVIVKKESEGEAPTRSRSVPRETTGRRGRRSAKKGSRR
ncbi:16S rRNA (guanine(527)-N(7))-methyltransferase RsmG [Cellulomonas sp. NPDC089187]|uniref:16S rRNA (guanine(527)-N(7))-methyltransferase RsmG n=1 Tax=Cellulomonas sp. NPDC089187 TaxID=3154970 RepID=UPI0034183B0D